jgi:hypothetical protein
MLQLGKGLAPNCSRAILVLPKIRCTNDARDKYDRTAVHDQGRHRSFGSCNSSKLQKQPTACRSEASDDGPGPECYVSEFHRMVKIAE